MDVQGILKASRELLDGIQPSLVHPGDRSGDSPSPSIEEPNLNQPETEIFKSSPPVGDDGFVFAPFGILPFRAELITFIQTYFEQNEDLPTLKALTENFKEDRRSPKNNSEWKKALEEINDSLEGRGLPTFRTVENYIDPRFAAAVNQLCNISDKKSKQAKLKDCGLTTAQFDSFMSRKRYYEYMMERFNKVFDNNVELSAKLAITKGVESGDLAAVKYFHEFTGKYRPQDNSVDMISAVIQAMMEILVRHVSTEIVNTIASDLRSAPAIQRAFGAIETKAS